MNDDELAVNEVKAALRQVVSVNPQLLFQAAKALWGDFNIEIIQEQLAEKPSVKKLEAYTLRGVLCGVLAKFLLDSGRAELDQSDYDAMGGVLRILASMRK